MFLSCVYKVAFHWQGKAFEQFCDRFTAQQVVTLMRDSLAARLEQFNGRWIARKFNTLTIQYSLICS